MKARYTILGLSVFLALALAVPALGGPSNPVAHTASALSKAKKAITLANNAQNTANTANSTANTALTTANQAKTAAAAAQTAANNANANANTRVQDSVERIGPGSGAASTGNHSDSVACNSGEVTLGGGFFTSASPAGDTNKVTVTTSDPLIFYNDGWFTAGVPISGFNPSWSIGAIVECGTK